MGLLSLFGGRGGDETAPADRLPRELVLAIERATIAERGDPDPETGDVRIFVQVVGVGTFYWEGTKPAAARIERHWPELSAAGARRAARLLGDVIASRNRAEFRGDGSRRGWVWDLSR